MPPGPETIDTYPGPRGDRSSPAIRDRHRRRDRARYIRVNVLTGLMNTDQGAIVGRAAEVLRHRSKLGATDVAICADVFVEHVVPPVGITIEEAASETVERRGADALVVSGLPMSTRALELGRSTVPVGSGASAEAPFGMAGLP